MSGTTVSPAPGDRAPSPGGRASRRRSLLVALAVASILAVAVAGVIRFGHITLPTPLLHGSAPSGANNGGNSTALYTVGPPRDLSSQTSTSGTLGYAGSYSVVNQAQGTLTWLPSAGQVIGQGQVLYRVDGSPVVLLYGATPAYRDLSEGADPGSVTGPDVQELNADLVALGYVSASDLSPTSDVFDWWTRYGIEQLQAALGVEQTGTLSLGQVVFLPTAARITSVGGTLGGVAGPGQALLTASSSARQVAVSLDASEQSELAVGDQVEIGLPNGQSTPGTVTSIGSVAMAGSDGNPPTVQVVITPTDPSATGSLDQSPVDVTITTRTVKNALVVPVAALLARNGGGYEVETVDGRGRHHLVPVSLGLFDDADGLVQVTDTGLRAGERVLEASA